MHLGLIGFGSIGRALVERMPSDVVSEITVLQRRPVTEQVPKVTFVADLSDILARHADVIVECAGHQALHAYLPKILSAGVPIIPASLGAFSDPDLLVLTEAFPAQTIFPSGAIGGLDILRALAGAGDVDVIYRGIKPPKAWKGSPTAAQIDLDALTDRKVFFSGTAREAAQSYPKNANVVAALALAGPGFEGVQVELIADPAAEGNTHRYEVASPVCRYEMKIVNAATAGNARTSETTILSLLEEVKAFSKRQRSL